MKIAIPTVNNEVSQHFGYCEGFHIYTIENNTITNQTFIPNPGHQPGFLPNYLHKLGVNLIIAGGIGGNAISIFNNLQIDVITGANGFTDEIIYKYLKSTLVSSQSACHEHLHKDTCH